MEKTLNYQLNQPAQTDFYNVDDFNANFDIIDKALKENEGGIRKTQTFTTNIDLSKVSLGNGNIFKITPASSLILSVTNATLSPNTIKEFEVHITMGSIIRTITWWSGITWLDGAPVFKANTTAAITFRMPVDGVFQGNLAYEY